MPEKKTVAISGELYKQLEVKMGQNNFRSIDQYVEHLLSQILEVEAEGHDLDAEEEEQIKEKLRKLGYI